MQQSRPHCVGFVETARFFLRVRHDAISAFEDLHAAHGPTVELRLPGLRLISITDLEDVRRVTKDNYQNYSKGKQGEDLAPLWGDENVLLSHGSKWVAQRKVCAPLFRPGRTDDYQRHIVEHARKTLDSLSNAAQTGTPIRLYDELRRAIMRVFCAEWFGIEQTAADELGEMLSSATDIAAARVLALIKPPLWLPSPQHREYRAVCRDIHHKLTDLLATQRSKNALQTHLHTQGTDGNPTLGSDEIRNNVLVFLLAAYEFPTLGWILYYLGREPGAMGRIHDEVDSVLNGADPASDHLAQLQWTRMCMQEGMRLFTSSPILARFAVEKDQLQSTSIRPGDMITIPICVIHKNKTHWHHPERFAPERFASETAIQPFTYMPFGAGARECIGKRLALQVQMTILAMLFQRYSYQLCSTAAPTPYDNLKPRPSDGVLVRLSLRSSQMGMDKRVSSARSA